MALKITTGTSVKKPGTATGKKPAKKTGGGAAGKPKYLKFMTGKEASKKAKAGGSNTSGRVRR